MIQADGLTKYYGHQTAIKNVSFQVKRGEILGFLGPNGAGKTTTMRILTAYMPPSEGVATIDGYDVFLNSLEVRKRVGYLPESVPLYTDMTVWDYLDYVAALRKVNNRAKRIRTTLDKVDLGDRANMLIGKLSKGMRQRVGIAQAVVHDPEVLILDEPTIGLDPKQIMEVRELIKSLGGEHTVLLSTHILSEVEQICSRVLIINRGQIVAEDTPSDLTSHMEGSERIRVQLEQAGQDVIEQFQAIQNVSKVVTMTPNIFELECSSDEDCRPEIARVAVENGWGLLELNSVSVSLEDVFLELTTSTKDMA